MWNTSWVFCCSLCASTTGGWSSPTFSSFLFTAERTRRVSLNWSRGSSQRALEIFLTMLSWKWAPARASVCCHGKAVVQPAIAFSDSSSPVELADHNPNEWKRGCADDLRGDKLPHVWAQPFTVAVFQRGGMTHVHVTLSNNGKPGRWCNNTDRGENRSIETQFSSVKLG